MPECSFCFVEHMHRGESFSDLTFLHLPLAPGLDTTNTMQFASTVIFSTSITLFSILFSAVHQYAETPCYWLRNGMWLAQAVPGAKCQKPSANAKRTTRLPGQRSRWERLTEKSTCRSPVGSRNGTASTFDLTLSLLTVTCSHRLLLQ